MVQDITGDTNSRYRCYDREEGDGRDERHGRASGAQELGREGVVLASLSMST